MISRRVMEIAVGVFVAIGLAALVMLAMKVSNLGNFSTDNTYQLIARFDNIGGLKVRSPVMVAGVRVGQVTGVTVDGETYEAVVTMDIDQSYKVPLDTSASIFTAGLLGEQYISLEPGGELKMLANGDDLKLTQSALVLEQVIGQVLFSKAAGDE